MNEHKCNDRDCPGVPCGSPHAGDSNCPYCPGGSHWEDDKPQSQGGAVSDKKKCRSRFATSPLLYSDTIEGKQSLRDDLWVLSTAVLNQLEDSLLERDQAQSRIEELEARAAARLFENALLKARKAEDKVKELEHDQEVMLKTGDRIHDKAQARIKELEASLAAFEDCSKCDTYCDVRARLEMSESRREQVNRQAIEMARDLGEVLKELEEAKKYREDESIRANRNLALVYDAQERAKESAASEAGLREALEYIKSKVKSLHPLLDAGWRWGVFDWQKKADKALALPKSQALAEQNKTMEHDDEWCAWKPIAEKASKERDELTSKVKDLEQANAAPRSRIGEEIAKEFDNGYDCNGNCIGDIIRRLTSAEGGK